MMVRWIKLLVAATGWLGGAAVFSIVTKSDSSSCKGAGSTGGATEVPDHGSAPKVCDAVVVGMDRGLGAA